MKKFNEDELNMMEKIDIKFKKDLEEFSIDVECENPIQVILKGHLYIEHEMRELLKRKLKRPKALKCEKLKYLELARIIFAFEILPFDLYSTVIKINLLRNTCSHNLNYKFGEEEYKDIEKTFSDDFKKQYLSFLKSCDNPNDLIKLQMIIFTVWQTIYAENNIPKKIKEKLI